VETRASSGDEELVQNWETRWGGVDVAAGANEELVHMSGFRFWSDLYMRSGAGSRAGYPLLLVTFSESVIENPS